MTLQKETWRFPINDLLKKYIDDKKIYNDLVRLRELVDEQDKLLGID